MPINRRHQASLAVYIRAAVALRNASGPLLGSHSFARLWRLFGRVPLHTARALACFVALAGCSVSMPMASLIPKPHNDEIGATAKSKLVGWLDDDDWKHAKAAFSRALDTEKKGATANWQNPTSGSRGTFVALGRAYPGSDGLCRAFHANIDREAAQRILDGTACTGKSGEWQVTEIKPAPKG